VLKIKENEFLYETFKSKYECAVELINSLDKEKGKLQKRIKKLKNFNQSTLYQRTSYYEGEDSPIKAVDIDSSYINDSPVNRIYDRRESVMSDVRTTIMFNEQENVTLRKSLSDLEKLKEDYFNLYEDKRTIEIRLLDCQPYEQKYKEIEELYTNLLINYEAINSKFNHVNEEKNLLHERLNKIFKENLESTQTIKSLKDSLNSSEKERNLTKTKFTESNSKTKLLEKEISVLRKKIQNSNGQIKDLKEKIKEEIDEKIFLEKRTDDIIQEFENKLAVVEAEKQKIMKDSVTHLMNSINDEKCIEFYFNKMTNKIDIYFQGEKIIDVENMSNEQNEGQENQNYLSTNCDTNYYSNSNQNPLNTEGTLIYQKTENSEYPSSAVKLNTKGTLYTQSEDNSETNFNKGNIGVSLNKLFSKSKSSQKSILNSNKLKMTGNGDKENDSTYINNIIGQTATNKKFILGHLSSSKKKPTEYSKLEKGIVVPPINLFNINNFNTIDSCIRKTDLSNNLRYVLSSNRPVRKILSLDVAMGSDQRSDTESDVSEKDFGISMKRKLNFYSTINQINFEINSEIRKIKINSIDTCSKLQILSSIEKVEQSVNTECPSEEISIKIKDKNIPIENESFSISPFNKLKIYSLYNLSIQSQNKDVFHYE
jgi:hypothetical protein